MVDEHNPDIIICCEIHLDKTYKHAVKCFLKVISSFERIDFLEVEECFRVFQFLICDLILENHPYGRIWNFKYLIIKVQAA